MTRKHNLGLVLGSILLRGCIALSALYLAVTWGEAQENRFANHAEAQDSQRRGWLPKTLPLSASEIHEWHELDTNQCFGSFRFDPRERAAIEVTLRPGLTRPIRIDRDPSFAGPLPRDPTEEQLASAGFEFYTDKDFAFAIKWNKGIAYFWKPSS